MRMRINMFSAHRGYGFCSDEEGNSVFFHAEDFHRLTPGGPPPILGEWVEIGTEWSPSPQPNGSPRTNYVKRVEPHSAVVGTVKSFDVKAGWGFVIDPEGTEYFLHRSDMVGTGIPLGGGSVSFYRCFKRNKPRACHVVLHG